MQSIPTNGHLTAGAIAARLDRLPQTFTVWKLIILLSFGFFFELYDLLFTGNIAPGLVKSGILTPTTPGLFGSTGLASFVAALFAGLFIGAIACGFLADKYGRRAIFTYSLLWYTATNVLMAFQSTAFGLNFWRFLSGIGIGVELVVIGSYLSELVPKHIRGRAFACCQAIGFTAVPVAAFLSYLLVPQPVARHDHMREMWTPPYLTRSIMMMIFNIFQTVSFYGFLNWVPTLLIKQGITITNTLFYTSLIALAAPIGPLLGLLIADRFERKHVLVVVSLAIIVCGLAFSQASGATAIVLLGSCLTLGNNMMSFTFHAYQQELFPTGIRARAVGFVYSWSRFSAIFTGFVIAFVLEHSGVTGVFVFIAAAMLVALLAVALMGPRTRNLALEQISN